MFVILSVALASPPERIEELIQQRSIRGLSSAPAVPREAYDRALAGEVVTGLQSVEGHKAQIAWGVGVVSQPIDRYWAAVNDDRKKTEYTKLAHVELVAGEYCGAKRTAFQYLDVAMLTDRWWVVDQVQNTRLHQQTGGRIREMWWKSVDTAESALSEGAREWAAKGMRLPFTEGSWTLVDLGDGRTLIEYYAWSDPGGNVPAKMASSFAAGGISETIASMAQLAPHLLGGGSVGTRPPQVGATGGAPGAAPRKATGGRLPVKPPGGGSP